MSAAPTAPSDAPTSSPAADQLADRLHYTMLRLQRYVARYAHRMLQANGTLSDLYVSFREAAALVGRDPRSRSSSEQLATQLDWPSLDEVDALLAAAEGRRRADGDASRALARGGALPIENLRRLFGLTDRQIDVLIAAAAPILSVDVARLYAFAWADFSVKRPSVGFLCELLADTPEQVGELVRELRGDSPLIHYRLIELRDASGWGHPTPLLHQSVSVPDRIGAYLQQHPHPLSSRVADTCVLSRPEEALPIDRLVLPDDARRELDLALRQATSDPRGRPRLILMGGDGVGRATSLRAYLAPYGWGLLSVDMSRLVQERERLEEGLVEICREALLHRCMLLIRGDELLVDRAKLAELARPLARVLEPFDGLLAFTSGRRVPMIHRILSDVFEVAIPLPSTAQQRDLWRRALEQAGCSVEPDGEALLTQRFGVSPGAIHRAVHEAKAREALLSEKTGAITLEVSELAEAIRRKTVHALGSIAEPFTTSLDWDDVVLPDSVLRALREILGQAKHREKVFEQWGFNEKITYGRGLSCLFSGQPGTGKTMMAAVMAKSLGRELYRVDLSRVVSKWVGETEKNLSLAFDEAERAQLILLFDEADALFSKRTKTQSSNDRSANMEINYLLQRMEAYDGMTILTTNKEKGIDDAFRRRLKFKLNFPMPDAPLRARLWRSMLPRGLDREADIAFDYLGEEFEMAGGNIKNAVLRAAFYAAEDGDVLTDDHLYRAALQEAREMGKVVREAFPD